MGYFYLILQALIFSFGGLLIKSVGTMLSPFLTSCLRFTIGIAMLFLIQRFRTGKLRLTLTDRVILIGGVCKALHYLAENFGVMRGFSYGVVLVWPVQTVVIFLVSRLFYKERADYCTLAGTILCVAGVITISWNGASLSVFLGSGGITMAALVLAGIGAAGFYGCCGNERVHVHIRLDHNFIGSDPHLTARHRDSQSVRDNQHAASRSHHVRRIPPSGSGHQDCAASHRHHHSELFHGPDYSMGRSVLPRPDQQICCPGNSLFHDGHCAR